jgi:hypothetical protein
MIFSPFFRWFQSVAKLEQIALEEITAAPASSARAACLRCHPQSKFSTGSLCPEHFGQAHYAGKKGGWVSGRVCIFLHNSV